MAYILDSILQSAVEVALPFFPYTCSILLPQTAVGTSGGQTVGEPTIVASGVKCLYEILSRPREQQISGGRIVSLTHKLWLPSTADTVAITIANAIEIDALNNESAITFNNPVRLEGAFSHILQFAASIQSLS